MLKSFFSNADFVYSTFILVILILFLIYTTKCNKEKIVYKEMPYVEEKIKYKFDTVKIIKKQYVNYKTCEAIVVEKMIYDTIEKKEIIKKDTIYEVNLFNFEWEDKNLYLNFLANAIDVNSIKYKIKLKPEKIYPKHIIGFYYNPFNNNFAIDYSQKFIFNRLYISNQINFDLNRHTINNYFIGIKFTF